MRPALEVIKAYLLACFPELGNPTKEVPQYDKLTDYADCVIRNLEAEGYIIEPKDLQGPDLQWAAVKDNSLPFQPGDKKIQSPGHFLSGTQEGFVIRPQDPGFVKIKKPITNNLIQCWFDGNGNAINGKPGLAQWRVYWPDGQMEPGLREFPAGQAGMTNNFLEYQGLIGCLSQLIEMGNGKDTDVVIKGDSMLVVCQTNGVWRVKEQRLMPLRDRAQALLAQVQTLYRSVELKQCPSAENKCDPHA